MPGQDEHPIPRGWVLLAAPCQHVLPELHHLIAHIVARQKEKLLPEEIRFLRKVLGLGFDDLAKVMNVSEGVVGNWESGTEAMPGVAEKLLRVMTFVQPPKDDYDVDELKNIGDAPPQTPPDMRLRAQADGWQPEPSVV